MIKIFIETKKMELNSDILDLFEEADKTLKTFGFFGPLEFIQYLDQPSNVLQKNLRSLENNANLSANLKQKIKDMKALINFKKRYERILKEKATAESAKKAVENTAASAEKEVEQSFDCLVCLCPIEKKEDYCQPCNAACATPHIPLHRTCFQEQIKSTIEMSEKPGSIPEIKCFCSSGHLSGKPERIHFENWGSFASKKQLDLYDQKCKFFFQFLCGACHNSSSQLVSFENRFAARTSLNKTNNAQQFEELIVSFEKGQVNATQTYDMISALYFPKLKEASDVNAWNAIKTVLQAVSDPGSRAALQTIHLSRRPFFQTLCCGRNHCYRCKTKDFHEGIPCEANMAKFDASILPCPRCSLLLTKGDGCNTVVCNCGFQFNWKGELESHQAIIRFVNSFPEETLLHCALVMNGLEDSLPCDANLMNDAYLLSRKNAGVVHNLIYSTFKAKFSGLVHCALGRISMNLPVLGVNKRVHNSIVGIMYDQDPQLKITMPKYLQSNKAALKSFAYSLFSSDYERFLGLTLFEKTKYDHPSNQEIYNSLLEWRNSNSSCYQNQVLKSLGGNSETFLKFFWGEKVQTKFYTEKCSGFVNLLFQKWDRSLSCSHLEFSNDDRSVRRPGSVSSFPAAFCKMDVTKDVNVFTVKLTKADGRTNNVTIGVALFDTFPNQGSDGVGLQNDSFGLIDDRSENNHPCAIHYNRNNVGTFPKLKLGDEVCVVYDRRFSSCSLYLNKSEYCFTYQIPYGNYVFVVTVANNHELTIMQSVDPFTNLTFGAKIPLFKEMEMAYKYKKHISETNAKNYLSTVLLLQSLAKKFDESFEDFIRYLMKIFPMPPHLEPKGFLEELRSDIYNISLDITWGEFFMGCCHQLIWRKDNKSMLDRQIAMEFLAEHGGNPSSAAFVAASIFIGDPPKSSKADQDKALAFMTVFPSECNAWYDYNRGLGESLLPGLHEVSRNCKCLPRCYLRRCRKTNT